MADGDASQLFLYETSWCPYCVLVHRVLEQLGVTIPIRNIDLDAGAREELLQGRGRARVPVLRIVGPGERDEWLPESQDIVAYLRRRFGQRSEEPTAD